MEKTSMKIGEIFSKISLILGSIFTVAMLILIVAETAARYVFSYSFGLSDEFSGYFLVALIFLGTAYVGYKGSHIQVEILTSKLSPKLNTYFRLVTLGLFLLFAALMVKLGCDFVVYNYVRGTKSSYIWLTPQWVPMMSIPIGFGMLFITLFSRLIQVIRKMGGGV